MVLQIGTYCSGIVAPIHAIRKLQIPHEHVFSSEIDKYTVESIKANYSPCCMYGDISYRDNNLLSYIDLYVCSFPYQPFFINRPTFEIGNCKECKDSVVVGVKFRGQKYIDTTVVGRRVGVQKYFVIVVLRCKIILYPLGV
jgi:site-specific DNA-cytosine methylase